MARKTPFTYSLSVSAPSHCKALPAGYRPVFMISFIEPITRSLVSVSETWVKALRSCPGPSPGSTQPLPRTQYLGLT